MGRPERNSLIFRYLQAILVAIFHVLDTHQQKGSANGNDYQV